MFTWMRDDENERRGNGAGLGANLKGGSTTNTLGLGVNQLDAGRHRGQRTILGTGEKVKVVIENVTETGHAMIGRAYVMRKAKARIVFHYSNELNEGLHCTSAAWHQLK